jgi:prepilin-type N-terminal cleavage/methylation domain-containing protein
LKQGFTLVELAIVIVVIGILIIGVVGAQSIMESANRSSIVTQMKEFDQATLAFKLEYGDLPGDMKNQDAIDYGFRNCGSYTNGTFNCGDEYADGDGKIEGYLVNGTNGAPNSLVWEPYLFFAHLDDSDIMDIKIENSPGSGSYSGCHQTGCLKSGHGGFIPYTDNSRRLYWYLGLEKIQNLGTNHILTSNDRINNFNFTPQEAKSIDDKIDDGKPNKGNVTARRIVYPPDIILDERSEECVDNSLGSYNLQDSDNKCNLSIKSSVR